MPGESTKLGPFDGGINTISDQGSTAMNELVDCINFDVKVDGNLVSRPPITRQGSNPWAGGNLTLLGHLTLSTDIYMLGCRSPNGLYKRLGETGAWSNLNADINPTAALQYQNEVFFINKGATNFPTGGAKWNGTTWTFQANIPLGNGGMVFKDRLWVFGTGANASRMYYSKSGDFNNFSITPPTDAGLFEVNKGDGSYITAVIPFNDNILIFKNNSTWMFSYSSSPAMGSLRQISSSVGASNVNNVVIFENVLYVLYNKVVYTFSNNFFSAINTKVPFEYKYVGISTPFDVNTTTFLTMLGSRLICRYYDKLYVYHTRIGAWTRYETDHYFGPLWRYPVADAGNGVYYSGAALTNDTGTYKVIDGFTAASEDMTCQIRTRNYDMDDPSRFKRLFWWGADLSTYEAIAAYATLVTTNQQLTHQGMQGYTHAQLTVGTHQAPSLVAIVPTAIAGLGNTRVKRKFLKFLKSMRFRQIFFTVTLPTNGVVGNAPIEFYSIRAFIDLKEKVVQEVS